MNHIEWWFRKVITKFWQLPWLFVVIVVIGFTGLIYADSNWIDAILSVFATMQVPGNYITNPISVFLLLCLSLFISYFFWSIIKLTYHKPRPQPRSYNTWREKIDASSFPSIHTANSLICAFFGVLMLLVSGRIGNPVGMVLLTIWWFLFFMAVSLSRIVLHKHYPIDIFFGSVFGIIIVVWVMVSESYIMQFFIQLLSIFS